MKKRYKYIILLIAFIFLINIDGVYASSLSDDNIINICGFDSVPARIPKITSTLYNAAKLLTPVVLIVMGMVDFTSAVMQGDDQKQKKSTRKFINRFIAALLIFLVMSIVQFVFRKVDSSNNTNFINCMNCVLSNDNCGSATSGKPSSGGSSGGSGSGTGNIPVISNLASKTASFIIKALNKNGITTCDYCADKPTSEQLTCLSECIKDNNITTSITGDDTNTDNNSNTDSNAAATNAYDNIFNNDQTDSTQSTSSGSTYKPFENTKCSDCSHIGDSNIYTTCIDNCKDNKTAAPIT